MFDMNAYIEEEHMMLIDIFYVGISLEGVFSIHLIKCFVIIKKGEIVEPLFDFDDTKTLLLCILIKLFSISEINLTPKVKVPLRMLKIQHPGGRFESHMKKI